MNHDTPHEYSHSADRTSTLHPCRRSQNAAQLQMHDAHSLILTEASSTMIHVSHRVMRSHGLHPEINHPIVTYPRLTHCLLTPCPTQPHMTTILLTGTHALLAAHYHRILTSDRKRQLRPPTPALGLLTLWPHPLPLSCPLPIMPRDDHAASGSGLAIKYFRAGSWLTPASPLIADRSLDALLRRHRPLLEPYALPPPLLPTAWQMKIAAPSMRKTGGWSDQFVAPRLRRYSHDLVIDRSDSGAIF